MMTVEAEGKESREGDRSQILNNTNPKLTMGRICASSQLRRSFLACNIVIPQHGVIKDPAAELVCSWSWMLNVAREC